MTAPGGPAQSPGIGSQRHGALKIKISGAIGIDPFDALGRRRRRLEAVLSPSMTRRTSGRAAASTIGYEPFAL